MPSLPPGLVFALLTGLVTLAAVNLRGHHDAPAVAPLPREAQILADITGVDAFALKTPPANADLAVRGAATSIAETGLWLTDASILGDCHRVMIMVTPLRGLPARLETLGPQGVAVLRTSAGAPALPLAVQTIPPDGRAFHPGFPRIAPGELTSRRIRNPGGPDRSLDAYAETGRTEGLDQGAGGGLLTLAGAPVLDEAGRIAGISHREAPRRGQVLALSLADIRATLGAARIRLPDTTEGQPVTVDNYGIVADALRRNASLAPVICADPRPTAASFGL